MRFRLHFGAMGKIETQTQVPIVSKRKNRFLSHLENTEMNYDRHRLIFEK